MGKYAKVNPVQYQDRCKYASVIGIMIYVARNSHPEMDFSFNQCKIFDHNLKHSHEKAVLRICKYLQGTHKYVKIKGLVIRPSINIAVYCYVDEYFSGLYIVEDYQ